jgi:asparagine synthase (glutamine-hydrolysing)
VCGICGVVAPERPGEAETAEAMARSLRHRGPDGTGVFAAEGVALAATRLAIIDLSEAGNQPLASDDGLLQLVYNGETYNYRELRQELEARGRRFRTATDTEVVLHAYAEWGPRCVERFNGMWAFALWDVRERRLFASRDRFGIKPFYFRYESGRFVFASELKAFRADRAGTLAPNPRPIRDYLEQGYLDHTDETFFAGIKRLPPGHSLSLDARGLRITCGATFASAPASPADSTPPRSCVRSIGCCG